jgi:transposase
MEARFTRRAEGVERGARAKEDDRRLHRERGRLIAERIQHVNRIKGLCAIHGVYDYEPMRRDRTLRLDQLRTGDGRELPPRLKAEIARELQPAVFGAVRQACIRLCARCIDRWP